MSLKKMSEFKRNDYTYDSPDGNQYEITIVQSTDRKYVEIKHDTEDGEDKVSWDVEMLLDIADAVRSVTQKPASVKSHSLKKPQVTDSRDSDTPSDTIQASVDESLKQMGETDDINPVQSFSTNVEKEIENRKNRDSANPIVEPKIKRRL